MVFASGRSKSRAGTTGRRAGKEEAQGSNPYLRTFSLGASVSDESLSQKRKTTSNKPRDTTTPHGATAAESVRNLIKKNPRYSKRINYDALRDLFDGAGPSGTTEDEKLNMNGDMWTLDPEKEDEIGVVIEEGGGAVGMTPTAPPDAMEDDTEQPLTSVQGTNEADFDDMYAEGSDKGEEYVGDWDVYEQEV